MSETWVSVDDQWPASGEWVILGGGDVGVEQGYQMGGKVFFLTRTDSYGDEIAAHPSHWMPLPEPPQ